jgi:hypothetical protein
MLISGRPTATTSPGEWCGHLHDSLLGSDLCDRLVDGDHVVNCHQPRQDLALG